MSWPARPFAIATTTVLALLAGPASADPVRVTVTGDGFFSYQPSLLETTSGDLLIAYERLNASLIGDLFLTRSTDGGASWGAPEPLVTTTANERHPALVQLQDGTFQLYYLSNEGGGYRIRYATSPDAVSWTPVGIVDLGWTTESLVNPTVCVESDGSLTMTYDYLSHGGYVAHSGDGLAWDQDRVQVSTGPLNRIMRHSDGTYVLSYQKQVGTTTQIDIFTRTSTDRVVWSPETTVTTVQNCHDSFPLELANGEFEIFYAVSQGGPYDLYSQTSPDGETWSTEENWFPYAGWDTQPHPVLLSSGDVAVAWARGPVQTGTDVYFEVIRDPAAVGSGAASPGARLDSAALIVSPNPFRAEIRVAWSVPGEPVSQARVIDALGRHVATLDRQRAGDSVLWDGRDDRGRAVVAGTYYVEARGPLGPATARVVFVR
ncbi:MAG: exo-alpha-sialidase [Candidatus Eisenbacteria bacterium]|nr:exo-alpha-sialidase [Candidatus Eisenbacteria bacterium]